MESQQKDIFDWGVKGIVEGELTYAIDCLALMDRCDDWLQWDFVLLRSDWIGKDI
jgi:hypothetical protein